MTQPPHRRPLGLGNTLWSILEGTPESAPKKKLPPAPKPGVPMAPDAFNRSKLLKNARFNNEPGLALVAAGEVLRPGAQGAHVVAMQGALDAMGFTIAGGPDGNYGPQTQAAVRNFQTMAGLVPDGLVGPKTLQALDRLAPPPGKRAWDAGVNAGPVPDPSVSPGKMARLVVSISQHRAFLFDATGKLTKIYGVRTGTGGQANGRGSETSPGVRVVTGRNSDPRAISQALWPETKGTAFGTRLIDLTLADPVTGKTRDGEGNGQELHGVFAEHTIGFNASHGCVGLRNEDIEEIYPQLRNGDFVRFDP
ncbi:MAG: peptidoglycan-binding protein [Candidatus Sericytochromatia bacterium]|nr:peptidoglycan-binding protein [Candidatus Sericytochromatia bacterium]